MSSFNKRFFLGVSSIRFLLIFIINSMSSTVNYNQSDIIYVNIDDAIPLSTSTVEIQQNLPEVKYSYQSNLLQFDYDTGLMILVYLPVAWGLAVFTSLDMVYIYLIVTSIDVVKALLGLLIMKKTNWANNLTHLEKVN